MSSSFSTTYGYGIKIPEKLITALVHAHVNRAIHSGVIKKVHTPASYKTSPAFSTKTGRPIKPLKTIISPESTVYSYKGKTYETLEDVFCRLMSKRFSLNFDVDMKSCQAQLLFPGFSSSNLDPSYCNEDVIVHLPKAFSYKCDCFSATLPLPSASETSQLHTLQKTIVELMTSFGLKVSAYYKTSRPTPQFFVCSRYF
jgi:hypothetical protein